MTLTLTKTIPLLVRIVLLIWIGLAPLACDSGAEGNHPSDRERLPLVEVKNTEEFTDRFGSR